MSVPRNHRLAPLPAVTRVSRTYPPGSGWHVLETATGGPYGRSTAAPAPARPIPPLRCRLRSTARRRSPVGRLDLPPGTDAVWPTARPTHTNRRRLQPAGIAPAKVAAV